MAKQRWKDVQAFCEGKNQGRRSMKARDVQNTDRPRLSRPDEALGRVDADQSLARPELVRILRHNVDAYACGLDGRLLVTGTSDGRHPVAAGFASPVSGSKPWHTWRKARAAALTRAEAASPLAR
jgi:hypothetical protein